MERLWGGVLLLLLLLAACGADQSSVAVTPVMADTRGTYRLVASTTSVTSSGSVRTFNSYSAGTLRLADSTYTRNVTGNGEAFSSGAYQIGASVNTILNTRHGSFNLTSTDPPGIFTGSYDLVPDFTLTLNYDPYSLPDQGLITRSDTWVKESDSSRR
jgi:hypothetical protein